jgi:hypothetical protein
VPEVAALVELAEVEEEAEVALDVAPPAPPVVVVPLAALDSLLDPFGSNSNVG